MKLNKPLSGFLAVSLLTLGAANAASVVNWTTTAAASSGLNTDDPVIGSGSSNSASNVLAYSSLPSSYTLVNVGDTITLTGSLTTLGTSSSSGGIRFGLYNTNSSSTTANWLGYMATAGSGSTAGAIYELASGNAAYNTTGGGSVSGGTYTAPGTGNNLGSTSSVTYDFTLVLELTAAGEITITSSLLNTATNVNYASYTVVDSSAVTTTFNEVGFSFTSGLAADQVTFSNITIVPEPSIALLSGLGVLGLLRRRRAA
ncbi:MAG: PEP-CTERM sorting domain-containing protein [Luteolibacter sp.]